MYLHTIRSLVLIAHICAHEHQEPCPMVQHAMM